MAHVPLYLLLGGERVPPRGQSAYWSARGTAARTFRFDVLTPSIIVKSPSFHRRICRQECRLHGGFSCNRPPAHHPGGVQRLAPAPPRRPADCTDGIALARW